MYQHWDASSINGGGASEMGSTAILQQQQQSWYSTQIKTEPLDNQLASPTLLPQHSHNSSTVDMLDPFRHLGVFNSLTPPGYSGLLFQPSFLSASKAPANKQLTPSKPPSLDVTPPKSPSAAEHTPEKEETQSESMDSFDDCDDDDSDEEMGASESEKHPQKRRKGSGKPRQYKCKQCKQIFHAKAEFWEHTRAHIKPEKMLQCPKCPFVTEYKHHLEYHLRNHSRSKPFQCPHCSYSCVNKSMLNSHLKSHSSVLQYRCLDCNYATKYCHSLKLHLRKYDHKPDIVLNLDGTPNPLPIIDVYGTRRGPKSKATTAKLLAEIEKNQAMQQQAVAKAQAQQLSPPLTPSTSSFAATSTTAPITKTPPSSLALPNAALMVNMLQNVGSKMSLFPYFHLNLQMFAAQQQKLQQQQQQQQEQQEQEEANSPPPKRKGKAFTFEEPPPSSDESETLPVESERVTSSACESHERAAGEHECKFCGIIFKDNVLFSLHIGYHSLGDDPFKCNMCGIKTDDKVQFFLHIAKFPHS